MPATKRKPIAKSKQSEPRDIELLTVPLVPRASQILDDYCEQRGYGRMDAVSEVVEAALEHFHCGNVFMVPSWYRDPRDDKSIKGKDDFDQRMIDCWRELCVANAEKWAQWAKDANDGKLKKAK